MSSTMSYRLVFSLIHALKKLSLVNVETMEVSITVDISTEKRKRNLSYQFLKEYLCLMGSKFYFF